MLNFYSNELYKRFWQFGIEWPLWAVFGTILGVISNPTTVGESLLTIMPFIYEYYIVATQGALE